MGFPMGLGCWAIKQKGATWAPFNYL